MQKRLTSVAAIISLTTLFTTVAIAASHKPEDYPLRVHILRVSSHEHHHKGLLESVDGEGRANVFENGEPKGIDFQYSCEARFMTSSGYETYMAKWKKPGQVLVVLTKEMGSNSFNTCELNTDVKDFVYVSHDGVVNAEPASQMKDWMAKHNYDPEHGLNEPTGVVKAPEPAPVAAPTSDPQ